MKFVTFAGRPENQDRKTFQDWIIKDYLPGVRAKTPTLRGGVVRRRIDAPKGAFALDAAAEKACGIQPYDVIIEYWMSTAEDFRREVRPQEQRLRDLGAKFVSYFVVPRLQKDPRMAEAGATGKRPEITLVMPMTWKAGVTREFGEHEYNEHAAIALRAQPYMTKYEQNLVKEVISWTPDTPAFEAFGDFTYRTVSDLVNKFIVTEEEVTDMSTCAGAFHVGYFGDAEPFAD